MSLIDASVFPRRFQDVSAISAKTFKEAERQIVEFLPAGEDKEAALTALSDSFKLMSQSLRRAQDASLERAHAEPQDILPEAEDPIVVSDEELHFGETAKETKGLKKSK